MYIGICLFIILLYIILFISYTSYYYMSICVIIYVVWHAPWYPNLEINTILFNIFSLFTYKYISFNITCHSTGPRARSCHIFHLPKIYWKWLLIHKYFFMFDIAYKIIYINFSRNVWWHISEITCQVIILTCLIFMSSCQIFMLTCRILMLTFHLSIC